MALKKCPICELNYLRGSETMCRVCASERKHKSPVEETDEIVLCSECGENPVVHGKDLCAECLKEQRRQADLERLADKVRLEESESPLEEDISENE